MMMILLLLLLLLLLLWWKRRGGRRWCFLEHCMLVDLVILVLLACHHRILFVDDLWVVCIVRVVWRLLAVHRFSLACTRLYSRGLWLVASLYFKPETIA